MPWSHRDYTVGCICPMGVELAPVKAMLDHVHPNLPTQRDQNSYILGKIYGHNVVIVVLPGIATNVAAAAANQLLNDFPSIRFGLLVGTGGGVPDEEAGNDIRLGDVVVSKPTNAFGGVVQYDLGKETKNGFERTGSLNKPPPLLRSSVKNLAAIHCMTGSQVPKFLHEMLQRFPAMKEDYAHPGCHHDQLFQADYPHVGGSTCQNCDRHQTVEREARHNTDPKFHYGTIGSANKLVEDADVRDKLKRDLEILCVEREAAGLMDSFPCLVIRGISDYADSHKNKKWQPFAAATAAAYMKELLSVIPVQGVTQIPVARDEISYSERSAYYADPHHESTQLTALQPPPNHSKDAAILRCSEGRCGRVIDYGSHISWCLANNEIYCCDCSPLEDNSRSIIQVEIVKFVAYSTRLCLVCRRLLSQCFQGLECADRDKNASICYECASKPSGREAIKQHTHDFSKKTRSWILRGKSKQHTQKLPEQSRIWILAAQGHAVKQVLLTR